MKDVPAEMPDGFCIAAVLERANPTDAFVSGSDKGFSELPEGAKIGSSSLRRQAQLKAMRPDIEVMPLRGNVNTRLSKLDDGEYDAIILASAGLERLGLADRITRPFPVDEMLPAAAQGVVGIECLAGRDELREILASIEDAPSALTTRAERAVAATLEANCQSPVASYAELGDERLEIQALVAAEDGSTVLRESAAGLPADAEALGIAVAEQLLSRGAADILAGGGE
jgi:hydroxymethylbilane synthase